MKKEKQEKNKMMGRNENSLFLKLTNSLNSNNNIQDFTRDTKKCNNNLSRKKYMLISDKKVDLNTIFNYNNNINDEIYTKKISSKEKRSNSQPNFNNLGVNLADTLYIDKIINKPELLNVCKIKEQINNKSIYIINPYEKNKKILSFDLENKKFSKLNFIDSGNFTKNYLESFRSEESEYNSIFLMHNNNLYIITGRNSDLFYIFNPQKNIINRLCRLKNNHSNGALINFKNALYCISGKYNKKVEIYSEIKNEWTELNELNIERSYFSSCAVKNNLFCFFGYNTPTNKYLDSIEYYDINYKEKGWNYLNYKNKDLLQMNICGFMCMNSKNEKIVIFGGINGILQSPVKKFYQLIIGKNLENNCFVEEINKEPLDIHKNRCYYFSNGIGQFEDENKNYMHYAGFDNNYNAHVIKLNNIIEHEIYYFSK